LRARAALGFACLLAGASVLSACSASDTLDKLNKAQYLAQLRAVVAQVKKEARVPRQLLQAKDAKERKQVLNRAVADFDATVKSLDAITPPSEVAGLHHRLVALMQGFDNLFIRANQSVQTGDYGALVDLPAEASMLGSQFVDLRQDFAAQGYETGVAKPGAIAPGSAAPGAAAPGISAPQQ
jgi:hypothetical protein